jgi:hypothetical protein
MTHRNETLTEQIEQLVRTHIETVRREATEALARALSSTSTPPRVTATPRSKRSPGRRRASTELAALSERLHEAVIAQPGETMAVLAPGLGCSPRELNRPMAVLKQAGRVRSVGQRSHTRYYPSAARAAS